MKAVAHEVIPSRYIQLNMYTKSSRKVTLQNALKISFLRPSVAEIPLCAMPRVLILVSDWWHVAFIGLATAPHKQSNTAV